MTLRPPACLRTVATTGGAASWDEGYDLAALVAPGAADAIMAMGYDFNWSGSSRAGGVSPLDSPYVLVTGPPADYPKLRRHLNPKYRFEPAGGHRPVEL